MKNIGLKTQGWLFSFLPLTLISGPFLSDLSLSLISIIFLCNKEVYLNKKYFKNYFFLFFIILNLYFITSSFLSENILVSLKSSFFYFRFYVFAIAVWYILDKDEIWLERFFNILKFSFLILLIDGFIQYFFGKNIIGLELQPGPRVSSFFGDELILGSYLSRLLPILFGLLIYFYKGNKFKLYFFSSFFLILADVLTFLSGERTAFIIINFSSILIIFLINNFRNFRLATYFVSLLIILSFINYYPTSKNRIIDQTIDQIGINKEKKNIVSPEHEKIYKTGFEIFKENKIFGAGPNMFRIKCKNFELIDKNNYQCTTHPHSVYLQILSETGILGLIIFANIFLGICFLMSKHFIFKIFKKQNYIQDDLTVCLIVSVFISVFPFIPSGNFFNNYISIIYFLPVGILLWKMNSENN